MIVVNLFRKKILMPVILKPAPGSLIIAKDKDYLNFKVAVYEGRECRIDKNQQISPCSF